MKKTIKILVLITISILTNNFTDILVFNFVNGHSYVNTLTNIKIENKIDKLYTNAHKHYRLRKLNKINTIIIHHSATESSLDSIAKSHSKKWAGIGYHFVIDKNGMIYQTNYLTTVSNHIENNNTKCIGICFLGNFNTCTPSTKQLQGGKILINELKKQIPTIELVAKHSDFSSTDCPGKLFNLNTLTQ